MKKSLLIVLIAIATLCIADDLQDARNNKVLNGRAGVGEALDKFALRRELFWAIEKNNDRVVFPILELYTNDNKAKDKSQDGSLGYLKQQIDSLKAQVEAIESSKPEEEKLFYVSGDYGKVLSDVDAIYGELGMSIDVGEIEVNPYVGYINNKTYTGNGIIGVKAYARF